jgi:HK97 family phage prohead protease
MVSKQTDSKLEIREQENEVEIRSAVGEGGEEKHTVYGSVKYNTESKVMRGTVGKAFVEEILPGAFDEALRSNDIKALWCHDTSKILGSSKSGTLRIEPREDGIDFEIDLPNNSWGMDARESIKRGDVRGVSFGMFVKDDKWAKENRDGQQLYKRSIKKANIVELTITGFPAYPSNFVSCRSLEEFEEEQQRSFDDKKKKIMLEIDLI